MTALPVIPAMSQLNEILQVVSMLFLLVGCAALFRYLAALVLRAPDPKLAANLRRVSWMLVALIGLPIVLTITGILIAYSQFGGGATVAGGAINYSTTQVAATSSAVVPPTGTVRVTIGGATTVITNPAASPMLASLLLIVSTLSIVVGLLALFTFVAIVVALVRFQRCIAAQAELARGLSAAAQG